MSGGCLETIGKVAGGVLGGEQKLEGLESTWPQRLCPTFASLVFSVPETAFLASYSNLAEGRCDSLTLLTRGEVRIDRTVGVGTAAFFDVTSGNGERRGYEGAADKLAQARGAKFMACLPVRGGSVADEAGEASGDTVPRRAELDATLIICWLMPLDPDDVAWVKPAAAALAETLAPMLPACYSALLSDWGAFQLLRTPRPAPLPASVTPPSGGGGPGGDPPAPAPAATHTVPPPTSPGTPPAAARAGPAAVAWPTAAASSVRGHAPAAAGAGLAGEGKGGGDGDGERGGESGRGGPASSTAAGVPAPVAGELRLRRPAGPGESSSGAAGRVKRESLSESAGKGKGEKPARDEKRVVQASLQWHGFSFTDPKVEKAFSEYWARAQVSVDVKYMVWGAATGLICYLTNDLAPTSQAAWYSANPTGHLWCFSNVLYFLAVGPLVWRNRDWYCRNRIWLVVMRNALLLWLSGIGTVPYADNLDPKLQEAMCFTVKVLFCLTQMIEALFSPVPFLANICSRTVHVIAPLAAIPYTCRSSSRLVPFALNLGLAYVLPIVYLTRQERKDRRKFMDLLNSPAAEPQT